MKGSKVAAKWIRTESDKVAVKEGCYWDQKAGDKVLQFFEELLTLSAGAWYKQPFLLQDWQKDLLLRLFAWKKPNGLRRHTECWLEVARKNGKSHLAAGIALWLLLEEAGQQVYLAAVDSKQAGNMFRMAVAMITASPDLAAVCEITEYKKTIALPTRNSFLRVLSADADAADGIDGSSIADEVHRYKNRKMVDVLRYSTISRRQPIFMGTTTAGTYDTESVAWQLHESAKQVLDGSKIDTTLLPVIYAADKEDDWKLESTWRKANPSLETKHKAGTITLERFKQDCGKAANNPSELNSFQRFRLNLWTSATSRWIVPSKWEACYEPYTAADLEGQSCYLGCDLSSTIDTTAALLLFPTDEGYRTLPFVWIPEEHLQDRSDRDGFDYLRAVREGTVKVTPGDAIDYAFIRKDIVALGQRYDIKCISMDQWNSAQLSMQLRDEDGFDVHFWRQDVQSQSPAAKEILRLIHERQLKHNGHSVFSWQMANVKCRIDSNGNYKLTKEKNSQKIDTATALVNALGVAMLTTTEAIGSQPQILQL